MLAKSVFIVTASSGSTSGLKSRVSNIENRDLAKPLVDLSCPIDHISMGMMFEVNATCKPFVMTASIARKRNIEYQMPIILTL